MPTIAFFINTSKSGPETITVFYGGIQYTINCIPHGKQQLMPSTIPPSSFAPVTSLPKSNLVQMALSSFNHDESASPPFHVNGFSGPASSKIALIFGNLVHPAVITPNVPSPIPNPPPPYKTCPVSASPPVLQF
ncbi:hypothetical protein O181_062944 [Austropuccinia psidii MF-1]|uniref:Uncharacterized protein n=1 Tax=Austropuccinia psidii MF-1 TaxID=1389203 RepID=A0A9Q3EL46_9BASI|nr:hypothetical protein [Austropuccinia psidii MF-1]